MSIKCERDEIMEQWNFPNLNGLSKQGISNSGVETFKGNIMESLTREICQNSLDASNKKGPVRLEFIQSDIDKYNFPGYETLKGYMNDVKDFWKNRNDKKAADFFKNACDVLESNKISVLRISDFNTTGLTGCDDSNEMSPWFSMVCSEGVSSKSGSDGGSFGIGKNSIYAVSSLRTIFFNTYDKDEKTAAQGVSKLASFKAKNGEVKYGEGFYGIKQSNGETKCCESIDELDNIYYRNDYGTDIFIMGFNNYSDWKDRIIISLLDNFLLAIYDSKLEVKVQDIVINKETLKSLIQEHKEKMKDNWPAYNYYQVLESDEVPFEKEGLLEGVPGKIKLKVKIFKDSIANRTVLMSRSNGMKLFDKNGISSNIQFAAILTMHGNELNQYFARMEDPTHTKWEPGRYEQEKKIKEATKVQKELFKWIKNTIIQKGTEDYGEEIDVKGMEGLLPEFYDLSPKKKKHEALENQDSKITINKKDKSKDKQSINFKTETRGDSYYEYEDTGDLDKDGDIDTIGVPHNPHSETKGATGGPAKGKDGDGNRPIKKFSAVNNFKKRIFISNSEKNEYTIKLTVNQNIEDCRLQVFISAESSNVDANIASAYSEGHMLKIVQNVIHIGKLYKGFPKTIKFNIDSDYQCNLEVKLYANKK